MDLFEEISKTKEDFPKVRSIKKEVGKYKLNFYQIFAIGIFVVCFFLGIILGNLFATCDATSYYYSDVCLVTEFNFSLMIGIWFVSLLVSTTLFAIGHIIAILSEINEKITKFNA
jgi:Na+/glutamate symporter